VALMKIRRLKERFYARTYMSTRGKLRAEWWGLRPAHHVGGRG
jgi:hypothetical protein